MRRMAAVPLTELLGSWQQTRPVYQGLAEAIRMLVLDGRLPPETRLPSERELARALGTSRTTVAAAYARLRDSGFLIGRQGAASRTAVPQSAGHARRQLGPLGTGVVPAGPESDQSLAGILDLSWASLPAPAGTARAVEESVDLLPAYLSGPGYAPLGVRPLRELIATRYAERGLPTQPDQIIVTGGALAGLALALRAFVGPGDRVVVEHPSYPNALHTIRQSGARTVPAPLDPMTGWDLPMFDATLRQAAPRVAYLIPDFHNPTGHLMDAATREHVAGSLARVRTIGVIDETMAELSLDPDRAELPAPMAAYDRHDGLLLLGSLSKSYWGGLGIGWIRAPAALVSTLLSARVDLGTSTLAQLVASRLLADLGAVLTERRELLRGRRAALITALADRLPDWSYRRPGGGMSLWCELPEAMSSALVPAAERQGVLLAAGAAFGLEGAFERFVRLPYTLPEADLADAVARVATAYALTTDASVRGRPSARRVV